MNLSTNIGALRFFAVAEGISYIALFGLTMPLKYIYDNPGPNKIVGYAHGLLFIIYCVLVFLVNQQAKWSLKTNIMAYLASLIPFGTFIADAKIFRQTEEELNSSGQA